MLFSLAILIFSHCSTYCSASVFYRAKFLVEPGESNSGKMRRRCMFLGAMPHIQMLEVVEQLRFFMATLVR